MWSWSTAKTSEEKVKALKDKLTEAEESHFHSCHLMEFVRLQGTSQTMTTLKNLVHKGVKVDLGMPFELWDEPSVEVTDMKKQVRFDPFQIFKNSQKENCFIFV